MGPSDPVPLVRCRLSGPDEGETSALRFIPLAEFGLWRHLMQSRHGRQVTVDAVSIWVPESAARWNSGFAAEELEPVLRFRIEMPGPFGVPVPVERFFPAETYPVAQEALVSHFRTGRGPLRIVATPGYFVPQQAARDGSWGEGLSAA
jgi:hypothetical protein